MSLYFAVNGIFKFMKKYIDKLVIQDENKLKQEIIDWKLDVLKKSHISINKTKKYIGLVLLLIGVLTLVIYFKVESSKLDPSEGGPDRSYFSVMVPTMSGVILIISGLVFLYKHYVKWDGKPLELLSSNIKINAFKNWFSKINKNITVDDLSDEIISLLFDNNEEYYEKMRYEVISSSQNPLFKREYEIARGKIFDNPYELSCRILTSQRHGNPLKDYENYLPLLTIKTNLFQDTKISITNNRSIFPGFTDKDVQLEDDDFNAMYSILSEDENTLRMILTPLVQDKWKEMRNIPPFKLHIENGLVLVSFKPTSTFMDCSKFGLSSFTRVEKIILRDYKEFLSILNLVFSISLFQFEEVVE